VFETGTPISRVGESCKEKQGKGKGGETGGPKTLSKTPSSDVAEKNRGRLKTYWGGTVKSERRKGLSDKKKKHGKNPKKRQRSRIIGLLKEKGNIKGPLSTSSHQIQVEKNWCG